MLCASTQKWHEGPAWESFFSIYDKIAYEQFSSQGGESRLIPTSYGDTQVHIRGNPDNPPLCFFHGISSCSLMFGEWLIPKLSEDFYCVAIDTIGDIGRSCPRDKDPKNGTKTEEEVGDWALQIFRVLDLNRNNRSVHLVGYSMGSFLASCVARQDPHAIGRVILLAPAGVLSAVRKAWLLQAISFAVLSNLVAENSSLLKRLQRWFFGTMMADITSMKNLKYPELRKATDEAGMAQVQIQPTVMDIPTLQKMNEATPTLIVIGRQENVINASQAIEAASASNMKLIVYENAGHMLFCEHPREAVISEIKSHLIQS
mmetsp:Transcript_5286/g.9709  ORF Transcript_5286/g.9709 Transcript_5286/m.9709 type:complete len:316 (+) Transcript_5286:108-1055(+)|eukprot:CAMPEP_0183723936 /NCGR_PEP_ID=MMETSP0737-20130205/16793_1 /TAXON_ID=385413 /ORGANISM="Thalassiosira miniscula, Strain CCMP1093" /LENGTH=315 /DNA_ID=CAMNT_0025954365 /DNA_START=108 /DNA_END=1055 /DNA_ORIENTATION=+